MKKVTVLSFLFLPIFTLVLVDEISFAQSNQQIADSLQANINFAQKDTNTVNSVNRLVETLIDLNENREGLEWANKGIDLADELNFTNGKQKLLINKADHHTRLGEFEMALKVLEEAESLGYNQNTQFNILNKRAITNSRMGNFMVANQMYKEMEAIADSVGNLEQITTVKNNMAVTFNQMGEQGKALQLYNEALEISEKLNNESNVAIALNNVGNQFQSLGNTEQAQVYLLRSKELSEKIGQQANLLRVYINLGNLYKDKEDYETAIFYHQLALENFERQGNPGSIIQSKYNLGEVELARGNYEKAREYLMSGYNSSKEIGFPMGIYYTSSGMGRLEQELQQFDLSSEWFLISLDIAERMQNNQGKLNIYEDLYKTNKQAQNTPEALNWLERYSSLSDSLQSDEKNRLIAEYEIQFGMRTSRQQNELLQARQLQQEAQLNSQRWVIVSAIGGVLFLLVIGGFLIINSKKNARANRLLKIKNMELEELNQTINRQKNELENSNLVKTKLFGIVAHDLRGPVNSMQSLLYLLREHDLSKKELDELTADMENSITENSTLMDNLLGWTKSQMEGHQVSKQTFKLQICVRAVTENFKTRCREKNILVVMDIPQEMELYADYNMIKLVIRNLFANSLKFSKSNSTITIVAKEQGNHVQISVIDEGVGIPDEHKSKIFNSIHFTSNGTENEQGSGLGLSLCKEFIESHNGSIWFESEVNKETIFTFEIPNALSKKENLVENKPIHF